MDKEIMKNLTKPFSKSEVKKAPAGKFGDYVPHHIVTKRLNEHAYGQWSHTLKEIVRDNNGSVRGVVTTFTLFGVSHDEVGDVDNNDVKNNNTDGELLKLCMSDALKRGAMRHNIGLHLWTGDVTEEEHYSNKTKVADVQVEKVDMRKKENQATDEDKAILEESIAKFEQDIGYTNETSLNNAKQIAHVIAGFGLADDVKDKVKAKAWIQFTGAGHTKDVEKWDNDTIGAYLDLFESIIPEFEPSSEVAMVEEVFGEVTVTTERKCPECNSSEWIEDNREKKASDSKFAKIPSWSCNKYPQGNKNGCGWTAWGDTDCPTEWL